MREKILIDYANRGLKKGEVFHSTGYAQAQSGEHFGAAEGGKTASFAARQAINEQRKYIQGYRNARITNSFYGVRRAQNYTPPSQREGAQGAQLDRMQPERMQRERTQVRQPLEKPKGGLRASKAFKG